jgi:hypothetical protein
MNQMAGMSGMHVDHSRGSIAGRVGHFVLHLLEMCAPMCLGLVIFDLLLVRTVGPMMGYPDPLRQLPDQYPEWSVLGLAVFMTVPMAAWMGIRRMARVPIAEMSSAMFALAILLMAATWLDLLPRATVLLWYHGLMMPAMIIPMLFRLDLYTMGHAGHQPHAEQVDRPARAA